MGKQPHVIINVGTAGTVFSKASPDTYSIEAYGYTADEVRDIFEAVHSMVRPTEDTEDTDTEPIPFTLGGFTLVSKLPDGTANPFAHMFKPEAHDGEDDELDRCGCDTDTRPPGDLHVRINSVNHRFRNIAEARRFALRWKLVPESVFAHPLDDEDLCCFPYAFQMADGSHAGFQTEVFAQYMAVQNGLTAEDVTYHADEHRPEHRARFDAQAAWLGAMSSPDPSDDHDAQPDADAPYSDPDAEPDQQQAEDAAEHESDDFGYDDRPRQRQVAADLAARTGLPIPVQRADATERDISGQRFAEAEAAFTAPTGYETHPNPCLPGCPCGNGPAPLATEPTDG